MDFEWRDTQAAEWHEVTPDPAVTVEAVPPKFGAIDPSEGGHARASGAERRRSVEFADLLGQWAEEEEPDFDAAEVERLGLRLPEAPDAGIRRERRKMSEKTRKLQTCRRDP